jgi:hypothetical protein
MIKKLSLALILAIVSSGVMAEWENVGAGSGNAFTVYVDRATIRNLGQTVKMWYLVDQKTVQKLSLIEPFLSSKLHVEYDCNAEKYRTVYFLHYSKKMGAGKVVHTANDVQDWAPIPPGSVIELLSKIACGRE